jgi:CBS domain-containing protein
VSTAAQIMLEKKVLLIVVNPDNHNKSAGIISETDISRTTRSVYENMELMFGFKSKPDFRVRASRET